MLRVQQFRAAGLIAFGLIVACDPNGSRGPEPAVPSTLEERFRARIPAEVLVRRGACPFECCTYREWTALTPIALSARERSNAAPIDTIAVGERFLADSGNVHITGIGLIIVEDTVPVKQGRVILLPGDTLVLLDHRGEGYFNVWRDGVVLEEVEGFWGEHSRARGRLVGNYRDEWWIHVTTREGVRGWYRTDGEVRVSGADRCA